MTLREEIAQGENVALEFKVAGLRIRSSTSRRLGRLPTDAVGARCPTPRVSSNDGIM